MDLWLIWSCQIRLAFKGENSEQLISLEKKNNIKGGLSLDI